MVSSDSLLKKLSCTVPKAVLEKETPILDEEDGMVQMSLDGNERY
jgi:hypothetical protein